MTKEGHREFGKGRASSRQFCTWLATTNAGRSRCHSEVETRAPPATHRRGEHGGREGRRRSVAGSKARTRGRERRGDTLEREEGGRGAAAGQGGARTGCARIKEAGAGHSVRRHRPGTCVGRERERERE